MAYTPEQRLANALRALAVLRAKVRNDELAMREAMGPEVLALVGQETLREFVQPPTIESLREYAEEAMAAYEGARALYGGLTDVIDVLLDVVTRQNAQATLNLLDQIEALIAGTGGHRGR